MFPIPLHRCRFLFVPAALLAFITPCVFAGVQPAPYFSDNAVLQQHARVPVWGTANPGEKITVSVQKQNVSASADKSGRWLATLNDLSPGGPFEMTISGGNTVTLRNILVGEVWFCAGQSNMVLPLSATLDGPEEAARADYPQIRLFNEMKAGTENAGWPERDEHAQWQTCSPESAAAFSATAYYFGRDLYKARKVPVGLVHASVGGSKIDAWSDLGELQKEPLAKPILDRWAKDTANYDKLIAAYRVSYEKWSTSAAAARAEGSPIPKEPRRIYGPGHVYEPGGLYKKFVVPFMPYAIRGVVWYQGESNAYTAALYARLFPSMITSWRKAWGEGDFPFLYVQLPRYDSNSAPHPYYDKVQWPELREAQLKTLSLPHAAMAVTIDIEDDPHNIHPKRKQEIGERLALAARGAVYGESLAWSGPIFKGMTIDGAVATISFQHAESGLKTKDGAPPVGFAIAGEDGIFVPADAEITGNNVKLRSDKVPKPVAVRYAWDGAPDVNLYNKDGLPASPFRTDDWPLSTQGNF